MVNHKSVLLIGLGRFGRNIAMKLNDLGHQVLAVDTREDRVNEVLPYVTGALIGDGTKEEFLATLGVPDFDVCVVAIGDDFQGSLETAWQLKESGHPGPRRRSSCCTTGPTRSSTQSGSSPNGRLCAARRTW